MDFVEVWWKGEKENPAFVATVVKDMNTSWVKIPAVNGGVAGHPGSAFVTACLLFILPFIRPIDMC